MNRFVIPALAVIGLVLIVRRDHIEPIADGFTLRVTFAGLNSRALADALAKVITRTYAVYQPICQVAEVGEL